MATTRRVYGGMFLPAWLVVPALCEPSQTGFGPGWERCQVRMVHLRRAMRSGPFGSPERQHPQCLLKRVMPLQ